MSATANLTIGLIGEWSKLYSQAHGYVSMVICIIGLVTNLLNTVVFQRLKDKTLTTLMLQGIAYSEMLKMAFYMIFVGRFYLTPRPSSMDRFIDTDSTWVIAFMIINQLVRVLHAFILWLHAILSAYRYVYTRKPNLQINRHINRTWICYLVTIAVLTLIMHIPGSLLYDVKAHTQVVRSRQVYMLRIGNTSIRLRSAPIVTTVYYLDARNITINGENMHEKLFYVETVVNCFVFRVAPCGLMVLFVLLLLMVFRRQKKLLGRMGERGVCSRRDQSVLVLTDSAHVTPSHPSYDASTQRRLRENGQRTKLLTIVVLNAIVTETPSVVLLLICSFNPAFHYDVYPLFVDVLDVLALVSNSVNFVIYNRMHTKFRQELRLLTHRVTFCCRHQAHMQDDTSYVAPDSQWQSHAARPGNTRNRTTATGARDTMQLRLLSNSPNDSPRRPISS